MTDDNDSPFKAQNEEWDALRAMYKAAEAMWRVPIVDDYYPEVQHRYTSALWTYLDKLSQRNFGTTWAGVHSKIKTPPPPSSGWMGIESAPKDGTPILGWTPSVTRGQPGKDIGMYYVTWKRRPQHEHWTFYYGQGCGEMAWEPTHWQPLPAPPSSTEVSS